MTPDIEVRSSGGTRAVAVLFGLLIVVGVIVLAATGSAVPLLPALWVAWYPVLVAVRTRVTVVDGTMFVRNPFLSYTLTPASIDGLEVVRLSSNWNLRRPVDPAGFQRLRVLVVGGAGRDVSLVATDRFRSQTGIPPEFRELSDSLGVPLRVRHK